ncbi:unnamed protein product [Oppiella nova]|uniref:Uncharacterized protein n=1 Tax=Oppiella nova TaxID=334625 RepID=A0A7R9M6V0_9ACAR|nr:unnamed protein product [Oppiella nova]CAG2170566.1 unnamed protein product [Oppiella nova]
MNQIILLWLVLGFIGCGWAQQSCSALNGPCGGSAKRQCCAAEGHGLRCDATAIENDSNGRFVAYTGVCQRNCQPVWGMCMPGANSPSQCCTELGLVCRETGNTKGTGWGQCSPQ